MRDFFFISINKTAQASLYINAFYSDSILNSYGAKGGWDAVFVSVCCVNVSWENIWEQAEVIRLCVRIFQKLIKYHPQSFGYFAWQKTKMCNYGLLFVTSFYKLNLIFCWTSAGNVMVITSYWLIKSVPSPPYL